MSARNLAQTPASGAGATIPPLVGPREVNGFHLDGLADSQREDDELGGTESVVLAQCPFLVLRKVASSGRFGGMPDSLLLTRQGESTVGGLSSMEWDESLLGAEEPHVDRGPVGLACVLIEVEMSDKSDPGAVDAEGVASDESINLVLVEHLVLPFGRSETWRSRFPLASLVPRPRCGQDERVNPE